MKSINKFILITVFLVIAYNSSIVIYADDGGEEVFIRPETEVVIEHFAREIGLSSLSVSSIIQDKDGYIWFGTQDGLNRYDGRDMATIKKDLFSGTRLVNNLIQTMVYDAKTHKIFIGTYNGLSIYDIDTDTFVNYEGSQFPDEVIIAIHIGENNEVWLGTFDGVIRLNMEVGHFKHYPVEEKAVRDFLVDGSGQLLIATYSGLQYYNVEKDTIEPINLDLASDYVMTLESFDDREITMGVWGGGIYTLDENYKIVAHESYGTNQIYSIYQTHDKTLWVGTWNEGLYATTVDGRNRHYPVGDDDQSLAHPVAYSLMQDESNNLWIGTNGAGVHKINPRKRDYVKFEHVENKHSLDLGKINVIIQDDNNDYWISVYNSGINRINEAGHVTKYVAHDNISASLSGNQIMDIIKVPNLGLLFATDKGIDRYVNETDTFTRLNLFESDVKIYALEFDEDQTLWIGTHSEGLFSYDLSSQVLRHFETSDALIYDIKFDSRERLWVATNNGLNLMEKGAGSFRTFYHKDGDMSQLASSVVDQIYETEDGKIWFASSDGGVAYYNEDSGDFVNITEDEGLSSNNAKAIIESSDRSLWVATNDGISIINPESMEIRIMTPEDGIGGWEFNRGILKDHRGNLLFGGLHGIVSIPDGQTTTYDYKPKVYITDVRVMNESLNQKVTNYNSQALEFTHDDTLISFDFIGLDFDAPNDIEYWYRLKGIDNNWVKADESLRASYSHLPGGTYRFELKVQGLRSQISETVWLDIIIEKAWYFKWYAIGTYILILLVAVYIVVRMREANVVKTRNLELDLLNHKLEEANTALENLSTTDSLTGLYNRRYFDLKFEEQLHLAKRAQTTLSLIMVDVDLFKEINDSYGHVLGDQYLKDIASILKRNLHRSTDIGIRYGGDEFVLMLYDDSIDGVLLIANRIMKEVEQISVKMDYIAAEKSTTVSIGIINTVPGPDTTMTDLIEAADKALYRAKEQGRDQICIGHINV